MDIKKKLTSLNELYVTTDNESELAAIDKERHELIANSDNPEELTIFCLQHVEFMAKSLNLRLTLKSVFEMLNTSFICREFFGKSKAWLYQRLNGNIVGGKRQYLSEEETATLKKAFYEIADRIKEAADKL